MNERDWINDGRISRFEKNQTKLSNLIHANIQNKLLKKVEKKDNTIALNIQEEIQKVNLHF
jgi:hypothetical protein